MANTSATCKTIFDFFQDVSIGYENSTEKNLSSALKIASCFALIAALYVGVRYVSSLVGRASQSDSSDRKNDIREDISGEIIGEQKKEETKFSNASNPKNERLDDTKRVILAESIDEEIEEVPDIDELQLEELFKSSEKAQKCFFINNRKVGVIFNPKREKVEIGFHSANTHLIVASLMPITDAIWEIIENKAPANQRTSTNFYDHNGYTFKDLGFI